MPPLVLPKLGWIVASKNQKPTAVDSTIDLSRFDKARPDYLGVLPKLVPTRSEGMGLGLPICERIIKNHGGKIE
jgi:hypothetical protein